MVGNPQFLSRHRRAVNLDLIGPWRRLDIVGEADLRNHKAVLARELAPHLADARTNLVARRQQCGVELFTQDQLDLKRLELLLDRRAGFSLGSLLLRCYLRRLGGAISLDASGD